MLARIIVEVEGSSHIEARGRRASTAVHSDSNDKAVITKSNIIITIIVTLEGGGGAPGAPGDMHAPLNTTPLSQSRNITLDNL